MRLKMFLLAASAALVGMASCDNTDGPETIKTADPDFTVAINGTTPVEVTFTVIPATDVAKESRYTWTILKKEDYVSTYASNPTTALKAYVQEQVKNSTSIPATLDNLTKTKGTENKGEIKFTRGMLDVSTDYVVLVAGLNTSTGVLSTSAIATEFKTENPGAVEAKNCTFDWEIKTSCAVARFYVTPSMNDVKYLMWVISPSMYEYYGNSPEALKLNMPTMLQYAANSNGYDSIATLVNDYAATGVSNDEMHMLVTPSTEWVAIVVGVDQYGRATTDPSVDKFTTPAYTGAVNTELTAALSGRLFDGDLAITTYPALFAGKEATYAGTWFMRMKPLFGTTTDGKAIMANWNLKGGVSNYNTSKPADVYDMLIAESGGGQMGLTGPGSDVLRIPVNTVETYYMYCIAFDETGEPGDIASATMVIGSDQLGDIATLEDNFYTTSAAVRMSAAAAAQTPARKTPKASTL